MKAGAVAGWVRGRSLLGRRLGPDGATALAGCAGLDEALAVLSGGPYGRELAAGMDLAAAQRAVRSTLLWHLRVLAGWEAPEHVELIRVLAGGFEISNVVWRLVQLGGRPVFGPYELGSLTTAWTAVRAAGRAQDVREVLARSTWGDPGGTEPGQVLLAMEAVWCRRVHETVPDAAGWAGDAAALLLDRMTVHGAQVALPATVLGDLRPVAKRHPGAGREPAGEPWQAEVGWWRNVEETSNRLVAHRDAGPGCAVGVVGLLAVDAWRTGAALALAGDPAGRDGQEALVDAVA